jgi:hypothetical protein
MNRLRRERAVVDVRRLSAAQILPAFIAMAVEEWRKLVAEVAHAFAGKPNNPGDAIEEKRLGDQ